VPLPPVPPEAEPTVAQPPIGEPTVAQPPVGEPPVGEPEPIFIAEQTPSPEPDPVIPPTAQMPVTPPSGIPAGAAIVPPMAVINPGVPGGPTGPGPGGPMEPDEPEPPWYRQPGPILVLVLVVALLVALLAWLLNRDDGTDDDAVLVDTTIETTTTLLPEAETTIAPETTAAPATTGAPATTAAPETTAEPETTDAPEPTQAPATTAAPAAPATTIAVTSTLPATTVVTASTTIPQIVPQPGDTLWDVIQREPALDGFQALVERADLVNLFNGQDDRREQYAVFAGTNEAVAAFNASTGNVDQSVLQSVVNSGVHVGAIVELDDLVTMVEIDVIEGNPQQIDGDANPPTVGGAGILQQVPAQDNGVLYLVDRVLLPVLD
jgi:uncharacterized surface protein with fasciclin (FAS1) repeats